MINTRSVRSVVRLRGLTCLAFLGAAACSDGSKVSAPPATSPTSFDPDAVGRVAGQHAYLSAPPTGSGAGGVALRAAAATTRQRRVAYTQSLPLTADVSPAPAPVPAADRYQIEGDRLYYLSGARGLQIVDITNIDAPALVGRYPLSGQPVSLTVRGGVVTVVLAGWYSTATDGTLVDGSRVSAIDARDPARPVLAGDVPVQGAVAGARLVGDVLYTWSAGGPVVSDYIGTRENGGYVGDFSPAPSGETILTAVSLTSGSPVLVGTARVPGDTGSVAVTASAILVSSGLREPGAGRATRTTLQYVDLTSAAAPLRQRGSFTVEGIVTPDFEDGVHARLLAGGALSVVDFTDPDAPVVSASVTIANGGADTSRFDGDRLYIAPSPGAPDATDKALRSYDLTNPAAPVLAGSLPLTGNAFYLDLDGSLAGSLRLFTLGEGLTATGGYDNTRLVLQAFDVTHPAAPVLLGAAPFAVGWSGAPSLLLHDPLSGLAVVPFVRPTATPFVSEQALQFFQVSPTAVTAVGALSVPFATDHGAFVKNRFISLGDGGLTVVDATLPSSPRVVVQRRLARNVVDALPQGDAITLVSSEGGDAPASTTDLRSVALTNATETTDGPSAVTVGATVAGDNARVFTNGPLTYVVTDVHAVVPCTPEELAQPSTPVAEGYAPPNPLAPAPVVPSRVCTTLTQRVQVVDTTKGKAGPWPLRGVLDLPPIRHADTTDGVNGIESSSWYYGTSLVQVAGDVLAVRRFVDDRAYDSSHDPLFIVDLANPDAPTLATTATTVDGAARWGDLAVVGSTLYASHTDVVVSPAGAPAYVRYYLDPVDLTVRAHPTIVASINVPGQVIGGSPTDPTLLYTLDSRYAPAGLVENEVDVVKMDQGAAYLQGNLAVGTVYGSPFVRGTHAYASTQVDANDPGNGIYRQPLTVHQVDLSNPSHLVDLPAAPTSGPGTLVSVLGDRAVLYSSWGPAGVDLYLLSDGAPPTFDRFVATDNPLAARRQGDTLFLAAGPAGVVSVDLTTKP